MLQQMLITIVVILLSSIPYITWLYFGRKDTLEYRARELSKNYNIPYEDAKHMLEMYMRMLQ